MPWIIEWRERDGIAMHDTGPSFYVSRTGWIAVKDDSGLSDDTLQALIEELNDILANVAQSKDVIH